MGQRRGTAQGECSGVKSGGWSGTRRSVLEGRSQEAGVSGE